jgi:hypothetical protein
LGKQDADSIFGFQITRYKTVQRNWVGVYALLASVIANHPMFLEKVVQYKGAYQTMVLD